MLLHIEGFEGGGTTNTTLKTYLQRKYTAVGSSIYWATGHLDNVALKIKFDEYFDALVSDKQTTIIGLAWKTDGFNTNNALLELRESGTVQLEIVTVAGGELAVRRGTTTLGTTSGLSLQASIWYYIELKSTIHNTTGSYELRIDGANVLSGSSIDTQATANAYIDTVRFVGDEPTYYYYFDDIYICDDSGSRNNDFLGNMRVTMIKPNAAGDSAQFSPSAGANYECVDDGQTVDDDTTYVEDDITDQKDLYNYENLSGVGSIAGIMIMTEARETDATDYTLKTVVKSSTTESDDTAQPLSSDYTIKTRIVEDDPHTSAQWTESNLNAAQFGIKVG